MYSTQKKNKGKESREKYANEGLEKKILNDLIREEEEEKKEEVKLKLTADLKKMNRNRSRWYASWLAVKIDFSNDEKQIDD